MIAMKVRTQYNYDADADAVATGLECKDPSLAQQHARDDSDINTIVNRYLKSGVLPVIPMPPGDEEFADIFDFQSAMNVIAAANQAFGRLPAEIRKRFGNDPADFVRFCSEEDENGKLANLPEMRKMGLAVPEQKPEPPKPTTEAKP